MIENKIHINETKITNESYELYKEEDKYYLRLDFDYENDFGIFKGHVDKINFDLKLREVKVESSPLERKAIVTLYKPLGRYGEDISFGVSKTPTGELFNITLVKEKVQEVTIEEIEKKFGHKIKIVSKKFGE